MIADMSVVVATLFESKTLQKYSMENNKYRHD